MSVGDHPLLSVLLSAAAGVFPAADGAAVFLPPLPNGTAAVVSLTGRVYLATDRRVAGLDGYGSALAPEVLRAVAGEREVGTLDVILAASGLGGGRLPARGDLGGHPRVRHAHAIRDSVRVYGDDRGLVTVAAGLAGRTEISVELLGDAAPGTGRVLIGEALRLVQAGEPVFAAVAPGNARSLRAFLACGFVPLGSEVIIHS